MADTFIKRPVLYKGTKAQIESATMGENDFGIATDVEFYTKEEINSLIGEGTTFEVQVVNSLPATGAKGVIYLVPKDGAAPDVHDEYVWIESTSKFELIGTTQIDLTNYATKTELNAKQDKLTATGTLSLPVYYDGTRLKEVTRLRAEMVSGGFDGEIYYAHHPEMSNAHILPFIYNDFAFIDKKGGSYTVTRNDGGEITNPHNIFDAAPSFMLSRGFTADTVWTAEISTPTNFTYSTLLYVDFGAAGFFCSYIKVEAQHSGTGEWKTVLEKTDNALSYLYCRCSSDDVGVNKFRFTFKNPIGSQFRISSIGAIAYKSAGIEETVLTLKGGTVFGDVIAPNITNIQNETTSIKNTLNGKVNIAQGTENAGKILTVDNDGNVTVGEGGGASLPILMSMWSDRVINDMSWLRADTFSWHSGDVYVAAYQHLYNDVVKPMYCWGTTYYSYTETPSVGDTIYYSGDGSYTTVEEVGDGYIVVKDTRTGLSVTKDRSASNDSTSIAIGMGRKTETIGDITITYYQADDGHKICLPDQESNLVALYEATGVAWYYVLDTGNKQFKLPRTKWGFTGLRDSVGGYVAPGLPNIKGGIQLSANGSASYLGGWISQSGAFYGSDGYEGSGLGGGGSHGASKVLRIDASRSSSIYGNSTTVQPPATQMYLYFYVGNFEQSAIEQTAGITSEQLNQKTDIDLGNITSVAKTKIAGMGLPDYTAGVLISSAQTFVTTENCYVLANHENGGQINFTITYPDGSTGTILFGTYTNDVSFIPFYFNAGVTLTFTTGRFRIYPLTRGL